MTKNFSRFFLMLGFSVVVLSFPIFVRADQWYDKLPKSGEYAPLQESGLNQTPRDLDTVNVPVGEKGDSQNTDLSNEALAVNPELSQTKPVGRTLMWWVVGIVGLIVIILITAPLWLKRVFTKINP